jgi:hypothetical protein
VPDEVDASSAASEFAEELQAMAGGSDAPDTAYVAPTGARLVDADDEFVSDFSLDDGVAGPSPAVAFEMPDLAVSPTGSGLAVNRVVGGGKSDDEGDADTTDGKRGKAGEDSGAGKSGGGSGGGGVGLALVPTKAVSESEWAHSAEAPKDARAAVIDYLDSYEFDTPVFGQGGAESAGSAEGESGGAKPRQVVSVLTLRALGEGEEPNEISSYLEEQIALTDTALGIKKDPLEIQADAKRAVNDIEKMTAYVDGPTPSTPTLQEWDATVEGLLDAVDRNPPNYL